MRAAKQKAKKQMRHPQHNAIDIGEKAKLRVFYMQIHAQKDTRPCNGVRLWAGKVNGRQSQRQPRLTPEMPKLMESGHQNYVNFDRGGNEPLNIKGAYSALLDNRLH